MCLCGRGAHQQQQSNSSPPAMASGGNRIACSPCQQQQELMHWRSPAAQWLLGFAVCCSWVVLLQTSWAVCRGRQQQGQVDCAGHVSGGAVLCCQVTVGRPKEVFSAVALCVFVCHSLAVGPSEQCPYLHVLDAWLFCDMVFSVHSSGALGYGLGVFWGRMVFGSGAVCLQLQPGIGPGPQGAFCLHPSTSW